MTKATAAQPDDKAAVSLIDQLEQPGPLPARDRINVLISDLFEVYTIERVAGHVFYLKALSEPELRIREEQALRAARAYRRRLLDPNEGLRDAYLGDLIESDRSVLISIVLASRAFQYRIEGQAVIFPTYVTLPEPGDAHEGKIIEETDHALTERQRALDEYNRKLADYIQQRCADERTYLENADAEQLLKMALEHRIELQVRNESERVFRLWTVYLGTYRDEALQDRYWPSADAVETSVAPVLRERLYHRLSEVNGIDPLAL